MGAVKKIETQIIDYLPYLSTKQKELVLTVVKSFAREDNDWRNKEFFDEDMLNRLKQMEENEVSFMTLEELESATRAAYVKQTK